MENGCRIRDATLITYSVELFFLQLFISTNYDAIKRNDDVCSSLRPIVDRDGPCSNLSISVFQSFERSAAITMKLADYGKAQVHSVITSGRSSGLLRRRRES